MRISDKAENKRFFDQTFRSEYPRLLHFALSILGDAEEARDVVSEVFATLWKSLLTHEQPQNVVAFLFTCTRNRCIDQLRFLNKTNAFTAEYLTMYSELYTDYEAEAEKDRLVEQMLNTLTSPTREILEACYLHRKKYAEVADEMGISPNTVKKHISKALRILRELGSKQKS